MNQYFVCDTEQDAAAIDALIAGRRRTIFQAAGFDVIEGDGIVGRRLGASDPEAQTTDGWDTPRERLDGKWVVAHPSCLPGAQSTPEAAGGLTVEEFYCEGIESEMEDYDPAWFPAPADPE